MSLTHREEKILEAVIDGSSVPFDPVTRREKIFAKAAGEDIELAPPITKEEQILSALAAKGSGGGGSSDFSTAILTFNRQGVSAMLKELPHIYEGALISAEEGSSGEYIIPVPANGRTTGVLLIDSNYTDISTTGNIVTQKIPNSENFLLSISGDCTITVIYGAA